MKGPRLLNYDLHILYQHTKLRRIPRLVLLFRDSEALEGGLLADLIAVLRCAALLLALIVANRT